ncbi:hypothetical protein EJM73_07035 [Clostridium botulinum]|uniref:Uncharacterized protein n=1 Tax=Clostridium botulinum TaxID=1491 RepID=A0AA44BRA9_CLOBO|nr:hypothetical protein [Clostridium botulinum]KEI83983.1 hypothetical protein N493_18910 [Clostridium botulinum B2 433]NCI20713.1 hypothetical protein [Clostridium botulinum]NCI35421.1 hypothetical protein [Clostridium botulinum]NCI74547.1 hypothetical protein [Clostridium botulinum]NDI38394.1 hypothetical protein [Clostridium botulinum]
MSRINSDNYNSITYLIYKCGWNISIWNKRYGNGFYGMISRQNLITDIEDILTGADIEACELEFYLYNEGNWLPISSGDSISNVLKSLEVKIEKFINNDFWINKTLDIFEKIIEENDGNYGFKIALDNDKQNVFKWVD